MNIRHLVRGLITATLLITVAVPSTARASDNGVLGILVGGAAGGYIGSNIGKGKGQLAATAVGALLGAALGNELGENSYRAKPVRTVYAPPSPPQVVYRAQPPRRQQIVYVTPPRAPQRQIVVHTHKVVVKQVRGKAGNPRKWSHGKSERRRQQLAQACYEHPRRCASAF
jgi:uncharacterized protein YcfJ